MTLTRRRVLILPLAATACAAPLPPRSSFPPLRFDYLTPLRLNVAEIAMAEPPPPGPLDMLDPVPPIPALQQMVHDRVFAAGSTGRAVFVIDQASIVRVPGGLEGALAVHLDVLTTEGTRAGFAEARVARTLQGGSDLRGNLYDLTRQMMDDMNVEFEFQVRRSLRDWLQETATAPPPPPVEQQELPGPALNRPVSP